jgi:hypothetical protein
MNTCVCACNNAWIHASVCIYACAYVCIVVKFDKWTALTKTYPRTIEHAHTHARSQVQSNVSDSLTHWQWIIDSLTVTHWLTDSFAQHFLDKSNIHILFFFSMCTSLLSLVLFFNRTFLLTITGPSCWWSPTRTTWEIKGFRLIRALA